MKKFAATIFTMAALFAQAQDRVEVRQQNQKQRIKQGVKSGELNAQETKVLVKQERKINRIEKRAEADGQVTRAEAVRIENAQDRASRNIARKKHNNR